MLGSRGFCAYGGGCTSGGSGDASKIFSGVRFALFGFDSLSEVQYKSELIRRGGTSVGIHHPSCTHVIVCGCTYDDPVCLAAREDGKLLVTELWVDHCLSYDMLADATKILYRPLKDLNGIPGSESLCICLTGYQKQQRENIMKMVSLMGARFSKPLIANQVTHLVCYKFEGEKYELAKRVNIMLVNHQWLEDCLKKWEILSTEVYSKSGVELEFLVDEAGDSEGVDELSSHRKGSNGMVSSFQIVSPMPKSINLSTSITGQQNEPASKTKFDEDTLIQKSHSEKPSRMCSNISSGISSSMSTLKNPLNEVLHNGGKVTELYIGTGGNTMCNAEISIPASIEAMLSHSAAEIEARSVPIVSADGMSSTISSSCGTSAKLVSSEQLNCPHGSMQEKMDTKIFSFELHPPRLVLREGPLDFEPSDLEKPEHLTILPTESTGLSFSQIKNVAFPGMMSKSPRFHFEASVADAPQDPSCSSCPVKYQLKPLCCGILEEKCRSPVANNSSEEIADSKKLASKSKFSSSIRSALDRKRLVNRKRTQHDTISSSSLSPSDGMMSASSCTDNIGKAVDGSLCKRDNSLDLKCKTLSGGVSCHSSLLQDVDAVDGHSEALSITNMKSSLGTQVIDGKSALEISCSLAIEATLGNSKPVAKKDSSDITTTDTATSDEKDIREMSEQERKNIFSDSTAQYNEKLSSGIGSVSCKGSASRPFSGARTKMIAMRKPVHRKKQSTGKGESETRPSIQVKATSQVEVMEKRLKIKHEKCVQQENMIMDDRLKDFPNGVSKGNSDDIGKVSNDMILDHDKENHPNDYGLSIDNNRKQKAATESQESDKRICKKVVGGAKSNKNIANTSHDSHVGRSEQAWFILSGPRPQRQEFQNFIRRLKGRLCKDSHQWSYQATHFIASSPIRRTEKFFAAAAAGRWILKTDYLNASNKAGKFLDEEPYEWYATGLSEDGAINLEAPRKWRALRERTGHGTFHGLRIIIYGDCFVPSLDTLKRVVKVGDGAILATSPPYTRFLTSGIDFAIVSPGIPSDDPWLQKFLRHEIPCIAADYLVEYVCKPGYSLERHVLYNTNASAEKSLAKLVCNSEEVVKETFPPTEDDDLCCSVCGSRDRGDVMLICGDEKGTKGCGIGTHIDCCEPPLEAVPEEDWFCSRCRGSVQRRLLKRSRMNLSNCR